MSIIVKGVDMPKRCIECPLCWHINLVDSPLMVYACSKGMRPMFVHETAEGVDEFCKMQKPNWRPLGEIDWVDDKLPKKPGMYLVTLYGDSICENYVIQAEYLCKPWHCKQGFFVEEKDITEYVIAWWPFPEAYDKSHKPIVSENYDDWIDHHL